MFGVHQPTYRAHVPVQGKLAETDWFLKADYHLKTQPGDYFHFPALLSLAQRRHKVKNMRVNTVLTPANMVCVR